MVDSDRSLYEIDLAKGMQTVADAAMNTKYAVVDHSSQRELFEDPVAALEE